MIILNNCIDCGIVPELIPVAQGKHFHPKCKCGKELFSDFKTWSREVAADMWNRANQVESGVVVRSGVYINFLAGELARYKLRVIVTENGLTIHETCPADKFKADNIDELLRVCGLHSEDLTEFYRKRLEPARI